MKKKRVETDMKAIVKKKYGKPDTLAYQEVEKPKIVEGHVLVRIQAASINQADVYILQGKPFPMRLATGLLKPKVQIPGSDFSGVIEEVGKGVDDYKVGDEVFGQLVMNQNGSYAEYALALPKQLTKKPSNTSHTHAAATPMAALTALQALRLGEVNKESKVLIYGASGGVGTFLIQIAKSLGAHVTAVCSTRNIEVARVSNADVIIDYKEAEWDKDGLSYDVIIAANGQNKLSRYRDALTENGTLVLSGGTIKQVLMFFLHKPFLRQKKNRSFKNFVSKVRTKDLQILADLLKDGALHPHIDKEFPLSNTIDALNHFYNKKTIGKTIIKVDHIS